MNNEDKEVQEEVVENVEETNIQEEIEETKELLVEDSIVEKAKTTGHKSLEEWVAAGNDPKLYKTEKEYVLTGELIDLKKTLQKRDKDIEEILKYQQDVIKTHQHKMRQELEQRLLQAKQNGDVDAVEQITNEKIRNELKDQQDLQAKQVTEIQQLDAEFLERNKNWHNTNHPDLIQRSQEINQRVRLQNPNLTYAQLLNEIELQMKFELSRDERYQHLIVDTSKINRLTLSASNSNIAKSSASKADSDAGAYEKLTPNQKHMYGVLKRTADKVNAKYTVNDFLKSMKKDEEI